MSTEVNDLRQRLKSVIIGTCNTVGCKDCGLKWEGGCSATELESKIYKIELKEAGLE